MPDTVLRSQDTDEKVLSMEEMSSGTVLGDSSPECSFPVLLYFNHVVSAREEAV